MNIATPDTETQRLSERVTKQTPCVILEQAKNAGGNEQLRRVSGWTQDCSVTGMRFRCMAALSADRVLVQLQEMPDKAVEVQVVRSLELAPGHWEYGARILGLVPVNG